MSSELRPVVQRFAGRRVLVVGDALLDRFLEGDVTSLCREAPVPRVRVRDRDDRPGGAANVAVNLAALGASVRLVCVVGTDPSGDAVVGLLRESGVDTSLVVRDVARRTPTLHRLCAGGRILARFDEGDIEPIAERTADVVCRNVERGGVRADAIVVSDYAYGVCQASVRERIASSRRPGVTLAVDARDLREWRSLDPTVVKPNRAEVGDLIGATVATGATDVVDAQAVNAHEQHLFGVTGARVVAVTLDRDGAVVLDRNGPPHRTYAHEARDNAAMGAGDTFLGAFTLAIAAGGDAATAAEVASHAAEIVVARRHTTCCSASELLASIAAVDKIGDLDAIAGVVRTNQRLGRRVVYTNGCFDILHRGHVAMLNRAKALGDVLVVGLNSDESVKRLKGPDRPINSVDDRAGVLGGLSCVDHIVVFDDDTSERVLAELRPDVYAKGGDYTIGDLPEAGVSAALGIEVQFVPLVEDRSTTRTITAIRSRASAPTAS